MAQTVMMRLFGAHSIIADGEPVRLRTKRSWAVLAYLLANRDRAVPRDELAALLWARSQQDQARASLRQELSNIRAALKPIGWVPLVADKNSVGIEPGYAEIDLVKFDKAVSDDDAAAAALLFDGPFLRDLAVASDPFERWRADEQVRLREAVIELQAKRLPSDSETIERVSTEAVHAARTILTIESSNERAHRALIRDFAAQGRSAEALRQYRRCKEALREELDAGPSPATRAIAEAVKAISENAAPPMQAVPVASAPAGALDTQANIESNAEESRPLLRKRRIVSVLVALGLAATGTTAVAGVQYVSAGQRLTKSNVLCALPFIHRGPEPVVTIGAIMASKAEHGRRLRWGMGRFHRDHRDAYPFAFRVSIEDSTPGLPALPAIFRSFERERIKAVIGPLESRKAWDAKQWGNSRRIAIVSPLASAPYLARREGDDYFFRVGMSDGVRAGGLVEWIKLRGLADNPYILYELPKVEPKPGDPEIYGQSQATAVKERLETFEEHTFVRGDDETFPKVAEKVRNDGRAVLIHGYTSNIVKIIRAMQERGVRNPIFLMGVVTERLQGAELPFPEVIHAVVNNVSETSKLANMRKLREDFENEASAELEYDISAYYAYDAMGMILDAVVEARRESCGGYASPAAIAAALRRTPAKRRKVIHTGFLADTQEVHHDYDGLRMVDGETFVPVGIGG